MSSTLQGGLCRQADSQCSRCSQRYRCCTHHYSGRESRDFVPSHRLSWPLCWWNNAGSFRSLHSVGSSGEHEEHRYSGVPSKSQIKVIQCYTCGSTDFVSQNLDRRVAIRVRLSGRLSLCYASQRRAPEPLSGVGLKEPLVRQMYGELPSMWCFLLRTQPSSPGPFVPHHQLGGESQGSAEDCTH